MTRRAILDAVEQRLQAFGIVVPGTASGGHYLAWSRILDQVVIEYIGYAQETFAVKRTNIETGVYIICPPALKQLELVKAVLVDDTVRELTIVTYSTGRWDYPNMTTSPSNIGGPSVYMRQGKNRAVIYPIPDYDKTNGLIFEGFGRVTREDWPNLSSECPVSDIYQADLITGLAAKICAGFNRGLAQDWELDFARLSGVHESDVGTYSRAERNRTADEDLDPAAYWAGAENPFVPS